MKIKYIILAIAATVLGCASLSAQTPEEIVAKMSEQLARTKTEGYAMDLNMKMPLIGEIRSHNLVVGDKMKTTVSSKDKTGIIWTDATTQWEYDPKTEEITVSPKKTSAATSSETDSSNLDSFDDISDGYKLVFKEETADAWYFRCKKLASNKDKNDPSKMDLAVAKDSYLPIYLRARKSIVKVGIENLAFGVTEQDVTFRPEDYPNAKIVDKR